MNTLKYFRLMIVLSLIFAALGLPLVAQAQNPTVIFFDNFNDGELDNNPTWEYSNTAWSVINGQLHHDGAITDSSGRYRTIFDHYLIPSIQASDYLEMSYFGLLKSVGNPQIGTGIELHLVGTWGAYMLRIQRGATSGANIDFYSFALSYTTNNGWIDLIVSDFQPEYDQGYVIKAIRQNGIWTLYVDAQVIGSTPDPLGMTQLDRYFNDVIGSVIIDDVSLKMMTSTESLSFHDDFDGQVLSSDYFYGTNSSDSFHILENDLLIINSGSQDGGGRWIKSNATYAYSPGSNGLIFETRAKIGEGERHFAVGLIGDNNDGFFGFGDLHANHQLVSSTSPASTGGLIQAIDQVDISEWHTYRIEVTCSTANYYVDGVLRTVDNNPDDIPYNKPLRIIFDKGSQGTRATLSVDYVDIQVVEDSCNQPPLANAGGPYTINWGETLTLVGSGSTDPDNNISAYEWDLDNDGEYDDATGAIVNTSFTETGEHTISLQVTDEGGLSDTDTITVTVLAWTLRGFYQPVDMNGVHNIVKSGSTVPLKFEVFAGSTELTNTTYIKSLTYAQTSCDANAVTDEIETTTTGSTILRYDTASGQFIYNWKTPNTPGKCYRVTLTALDGTALIAYFKLK